MHLNQAPASHYSTLYNQKTFFWLVESQAALRIGGHSGREGRWKTEHNWMAELTAGASPPSPEVQCLITCLLFLLLENYGEDPESFCQIKTQMVWKL